MWRLSIDRMTSATERLFSYGTLQLETVQLAIFGRQLSGTPDILESYTTLPIEIKDEKTVALSGKSQHTIARFTGRQSDSIHGVVFELTPQELQRADQYEDDAYARISVLLRSGMTSWVYVKPE